MIEKKIIKFWTESASPKIINAGLLEFFQAQGISRVKPDSEVSNSILIQEKQNRIKEIGKEDLSKIIRDYLLKYNPEFYEYFLRGASSHLAPYKLLFLKESKLEPNLDAKDKARFYFQNGFVEVGEGKIDLLSYDELENVIWEGSVIDDNFTFPTPTSKGQFEEFCYLISKNDDDRFLSLKTILGYLLHKNKSIGENKAVIFYDENMNKGEGASGRTGKTLLTQAISKMRQVVFFNGKELKNGQWFKNQRIKLSTDLVVYDDLGKNTSFEQFFSSVTSGIEVERKNKNSFFIPHESAPKFIITSNTYLKGPGGSSDRARRCEFELANIFNDTFTPEDYFKNRFFNNEWSKEENNKFYLFMMQCVQSYLSMGLKEAPQLSLNRAELISKSCVEFVNFMDSHSFEQDVRYYKDIWLEKYLSFSKTERFLSQNMFGKRIVTYFQDKNIKVNSFEGGSRRWFCVTSEPLKRVEA